MATSVFWGRVVSEGTRSMIGMARRNTKFRHRVQASGGRMCLAVLFENMGTVDFGIDLGGREAGVAEQLLDDPEIGTGTQEMSGEGMAEGVGRRRVGKAERAP